MKGIEKIEKAKSGSIVTVYEEINGKTDAVKLFARVSNNGKKENSLLLESADIVTKYGEKSIICTDPCIKIRGKGEHFEILALNELGEKFLVHLKPKLGFCKITGTGKNISGTLARSGEIMSEDERLRAKTHADILRQVAFALKPENSELSVYGGLFGAIAYDFIDQFESLPKSKKDLLNEPDYEMNFYDSIILVDHKKGNATVCVNAMLFSESDKEKETERCKSIIEKQRAVISETKKGNNEENKQNDITKINIAKSTKILNSKNKIKTETDMNEKEFTKIVSSIKKHILLGDVFQAVPSRTIIRETSAEPLEIYKQLAKLNPSPYMFYFKNSAGILVGSSPETFIKVESTPSGKTLEIRPIAGTKPRGFKETGEIDEELDSKYEADLRNDDKELAEHTMLIDLARNDVARVSKPGSRLCRKPYMIEKYSHVQHIVSSVKGVLKDDLDALHAYLASMNMGTLTGAPKLEAMKIIRNLEKTRRGFYGGSIGYLTPSGEFDSAIVIRSMSIKDGKAYVRAGAGIVYDSVPKEEFLETERKASACLSAIAAAEKKGEETSGNAIKGGMRE